MDPSPVQHPACLQGDAVEWGEGDLPFPGSTGFLGTCERKHPDKTPGDVYLTCLQVRPSFKEHLEAKPQSHICIQASRDLRKCPLAMFILETLWLSAKVQGPSLFTAVCLHWCIDEMVKLHCKEQSCAAHQCLAGIHVGDKG